VKLIKTLMVWILGALPLLLSAWANYSVVSTPSFDVYYRDGWKTEAENVLQALEYSRPYVEKLTGNNPGKVPVVLSDMGNMVNGYASPIATRMGLYAYPPTSDELGLSEDWWQLVGIHEYIHMAQMTRTSGEPAILRAIFGNILYPNMYQPMWMTEGITVYGESQLSPYTGRLNAGTYPAIISSLAREGRLPNPGKAAYYSYSNPLGNYYVYGSSFHQYLADTYGEDKFAALYEINSASLASYLNPLLPAVSMDPSYTQVYGKSVPALWEEWRTAVYRDSSPLPTDKVTDDGWSKEDLRYVDGALYFTQRKTSKTGPSSTFSSYRLRKVTDPGNKAHVTTLVEQASEFTAGYQIAGDKLYFSRGELKPGYANNDADGRGVITEIWEQSLSGGNRAKLYEGAVRSFCVLEDGKMLISEDNASHQGTILSAVDLSTGVKTVLKAMDYLIGTINQSQGKIVVTARKFWQNNSIYYLDPASLKLTPIIDTPHMESVTSLNGKDLIYNAIYEGKNGTYLYDLNTKQIQQFSGFSEVKNATPAGQGQTYFLSINGDGYDIYKDQLKMRSFTLPAVKAIKAPYERLTAGENNLIVDRYPIQNSGYGKNIAHMLWPRLYRFPIIAGGVTEEGLVEDLVLGLQMAGSDVVGDFPIWQAAVLYNLDKKELGYQVGLQNDFFAPIKHTIEYTVLDERTFSSMQYVPFLQRMNYGLTQGNAGFGFAATDNFANRLWTPFVGLNFASAGTRFQTTNTLLFGNMDADDPTQNRLGWQGRFALRVKAPLSSELRSSVFAAWDPDAKKDKVFPQMRGYDEDSATSLDSWGQDKGAIVTNTWYIPLLKIRDGLWNPNIYLEDINLGLFYDYGFPGDGDTTQHRYSYGAEIIAEIFAGYDFGFNIGARYSINKDGKETFSLVLGS
jgi:hypothetical protein